MTIFSELPMVSILCDSPNHPVVPYMEKVVGELESKGLKASLCRRVSQLPTGGCEILFLVSTNKIIRQRQLEKFDNVYVLHASALPFGKGWSPHIWQIIEGSSEITVTLFEAVKELDAGPIVSQKVVRFDGTELYNEINDKLFNAEHALIKEAIEKWPNLKSIPQSGEVAATTYRRRTPSDSEVDPNKTIGEQFDILRVSDPKRYPAFFRFRGQKYRIILEKVNEEPL